MTESKVLSKAKPTTATNTTINNSTTNATANTTTAKSNSTSKNGTTSHSNHTRFKNITTLIFHDVYIVWNDFITLSNKVAFYSSNLIFNGADIYLELLILYDSFMI